jgi:hypothetical protein
VLTLRSDDAGVQKTARKYSSVLNLRRIAQHGHDSVALTDKLGSQFFVFRHNNSRSPFNHQTLVVDTQLASGGPVFI